MKKVMMILFTRKDIYDDFIDYVENTEKNILIEKKDWDKTKGFVLFSIEVDQDGFNSIMNIGIKLNIYYAKDGIEDYVVI